MKRLGYISVIFNLVNATVLSCLRMFVLYTCVYVKCVFCACVVCIRIHVCCIFVL